VRCAFNYLYDFIPAGTHTFVACQTGAMSASALAVPLLAGVSTGATRPPSISPSAVVGAAAAGGGARWRRRGRAPAVLLRRRIIGNPLRDGANVGNDGALRAAPLEVPLTSTVPGEGEGHGSVSGATGTPSSHTFAVPPKGFGVVVWHAHMSWLFARLEDALGPLTAVNIPDDLAVQTRPNKAHAQTWVFSSPHARRIRFTYVDAGVNAQIFNCVVYPRCDAEENDAQGTTAATSPSKGTATNESNGITSTVAAATCLGDAPLLGVDLLCLAGGRKILVGIDLQPLSRGDAYLARYAPALAATREERFPDLNLVQPSKKFYEDAQYFSPAMLFARPEVRKLCAPLRRCPRQFSQYSAGALSPEP